MNNKIKILIASIVIAIIGVFFPSNSDRLVNFTKITESHGYVSEEHQVVTEDGYILAVFRVMKGTKCKNNEKLTPVLLMHGFLQNSNSWLDSGVDSLVYLLSDECYDLWVGNFRGNSYGRRHTHLDPEKREFWQFSVDERGFYDLPGIIDYILTETNSNKLNYIGFSEGGASFFVMGSERPNYLDKIGVSINLAPGTILRRSKSLLFLRIFEAMSAAEDLLEMVGVKELIPKGSLTQTLFRSICDTQSNILLSLCKIIYDHLTNANPGSITDETYRNIPKHLPNGGSLRQFVRYGQVSKSGKFQKYDYGRQGNMIKYKTATAPVYNLKDIKTPVVIITGRNDKLIDFEDVKWLADELTNVIEFTVVEDPLWNHFDMMYSKNIKTKIFPKINAHLKDYT